MNRDSTIVSATDMPSAVSCPYRGLAPYTEKDTAFFFGRDRDCDVLEANALSTRVTIYYGPSGAGKSSVLRAGLVQTLRAQAAKNVELFGSPEAIAVYFSSWRDDPIPALLTAVRAEIAVALPGAEDALPAAAESLGATLCAWSSSLHTDLIIVLDQFEEFFLYQHRIREQFARQFAEILNTPSARVNFVISLREDALAHLDVFQGRVPRLFDNCLRLEYLSEGGARKAIEAPLQTFDRLYEEPPVNLGPGLLDAVLREVEIGQVVLGPGSAGSPSHTAGLGSAETRVETPYLQLVMVRLWEECVRDGSGTLSLEKFRELGGAEGIVRTHLDKTLAGFDDAERDIAARVFQHLVTPSGTKIAHWLDDMANWAKRPADRVGRVLEKLCQPELRVLRNVTPAEQRGRARYEIFHDVLACAILDWQQRYDQGRRDHATRVLTKRKADREHAVTARNAAEAWEREKIRRIKRTRIYLSVALVTALGMAAFAWAKWMDAKQAQEEIAEALGDAKRSAEAALTAKEKEATARKEKEAALTAALASATEAENARDDARAQQLEAEKQKREAEDRLGALEAQRDGQKGTSEEIVTRIHGIANTLKRLRMPAVITESQQRAVLVSLDEIAALAKGDAKLAANEVDRVVQKAPKPVVAALEGADGWVYAGRLDQNGNWGDRLFDNCSANVTKVPAKDETLKASVFVNVRSLPNRYSIGGWASEPIVEVVRAGDYIKVQEVEKVPGPVGDPWKRIWVLAKRVPAPIPTVPTAPTATPPSPPPPRWVEFWDKSGFAPDAKHLRIDNPKDDSSLKDNTWPGTNSRVHNKIKSLKTGPRTWFVGFDEENFSGRCIKLGPNSSIANAVIPGSLNSHIESYHTYDAQPADWDQGLR